MPTDDPTPNHHRSAAPHPATLSGAEPAITHSGADPAGTTGSARDGTVAAIPPASAARYALGEEIARGGMGAVYRATDTAFDREVAVKVLLDTYAPTSGTARRFHDEARITGQLQHPNIPAVHDLGTLPDGRPFLAMKLIKGQTLDDLLKARTGPADDRGRFIAAFEQVCQAVAYAHAHKVIHRDLKPGNVMVGAFGEVQVMDWGLAKVLGTREAEVTDPDETASPTAIQSIRETDSAFTQDGSVLGTPAYMPPEQAIGAIHKVNARSDVFGLGAILAVILTGKPPFVGSSVQTTRLKAAQGDVEECCARLDASGAEPELVALCKRCLSKRAEDRPANASEVATAVAALRAAADERARQAELEAVQLEGERQKAELQAIEQRKRRRVQVALAGLVLVVAIGGGIAAILVQQQREQDRLATERQTRAAALVDALGGAETPVVPRIVADLADLRELARPKLAELAGQPITSKPGLHARLALLPDQSELAAELAAYLPQCKTEELLTLREALKPHAAAVAPGLWAVLTDAKADAGRRVRAACALAGLTPDDARWATVSGEVVGLVVKENPLQAVVWAQALEPVRAALLPALIQRYPESRTKIESGTLAVTDLAAEATAFDLTASLLARYTTDRPTELAELAMIMDGRHLPLFFDAIQTRRDAIAPRLEAEIDTTVATRHQPGLSASLGSTAGYLATNGVPGHVPPADGLLEPLAKRQASAAVVLLRLNQPAKVWPLMKHSPDPRVRSYLLARFFPFGVDPGAIVQRLDAEPDLSARRALLLALGEFDESTLPAASRTALLPKVQGLYRDDPDPGLHAAAEWLLRQWGQDDWIREQNEAWAKASRERERDPASREHERPEFGGAPVAHAPDSPQPPRWYVNGQGQTYTVIPGPVEFRMGSPLTEKDRHEHETPHTRRIGRSFAIASKAVTLAEYRRLTKDKYEIGEKWTYADDLPVVGLNWYMAARYCNLLSEAEGIPEEQWVYEITGLQAIKLKANYLSLTGYRLPTEAEVEYATRAGATTSRYYGETDELLGRYAWYATNTKDVLQRVGWKRPNELGLFDAQGTCYTWCQESLKAYPTGAVVEDREDVLVINSTVLRVLRGGSFCNLPSIVRSANRDYVGVPSFRLIYVGFRPARTLTS
jgi:formylglycine-generating enzyme required for sulfatase activity